MSELGEVEDRDLRVELDPRPSDVAVLEAGLDEHSAPYGVTEATKVRFGIFHRDGDRVVGGASGTMVWGWVKVQNLWVAADLRGQGLGSRILDEVVAWAVENGCRAIRLSTFSFQALPFYERHGFTLQFTVPDYPPGHQKHYLVKALDGPASAADVDGRTP
jgi:GNAT superfamily N-acetyltransferase